MKLSLPSAVPFEVLGWKEWEQNPIKPMISIATLHSTPSHLAASQSSGAMNGTPFGCLATALQVSWVVRSAVLGGL